MTLRVILIPRDVPEVSPASRSMRGWMVDVANAISSRALGTATLLAAGTSVVVTHGLRAAPTRVFIQPTADPTVRLWVSAKTATTFTVSASAGPAANITFDWSAEII